MNMRACMESDLEVCSDIFVNVFCEEPWNEAWTPETALKYLKDYYHTPGFTGILAAENQDIIGFIFGVKRRWWSGDEFFINEMCVRSDKQSKGVGKQLMHYLLKTTDAETISLLTDRGLPAETFYKRNGFNEIERLMFLSREV
ncbi:Ribosomal protein S18 acetylase RimI [Terribacillus aidingensis]|uniref:Ribosomal protein S18 acetylase RimI n=1 Tax=Terribacillus aidingensis TaxID=586416 RepID=A0A285P1K9_9BACI|nr:GNAT family N-acetyltransferase [Terribacillus aidingensis]SNZ15610.1 Ribosomal protein S18 acetylase RimI [Terribacillus aidingensis]